MEVTLDTDSPPASCLLSAPLFDSILLMKLTMEYHSHSKYLVSLMIISVEALQDDNRACGIWSDVLLDLDEV